LTAATGACVGVGAATGACLACERCAVCAALPSEHDAPQGIRVNSISPGTTVTPINDSLFGRDGWVEKTLSKIPDGRFAEPHEHVGAIAYLISDLATHVHGHDIVIDGGRLSS
jgi:NAD(P)-dependent dehydrogenase (short-subunit alcohol dehydrogenase family)